MAMLNNQMVYIIAGLSNPEVLMVQSIAIHLFVLNMPIAGWTSMIFFDIPIWFRKVFDIGESLIFLTIYLIFLLRRFQDVLKVGEEVEVLVKSAENGRLVLSMAKPALVPSVPWPCPHSIS